MRKISIIVLLTVFSVLFCKAQSITMETSKYGELKIWLAGSGKVTINWGDGS
jgi:hypothetical protein